jgi:hypothetical protein
MNKTKKRSIHRTCGRLAAVALLVCIVCLWPLVGRAVPSEIGEAELVIQSVRGKLDELRRQISIRDDVFSREVIETGLASATRLTFRDHSELSIGADSRVALDRFVYDPDHHTGSLWLDLVAGVYQWVSGSMPSPSYSVRMTFGTLAIRGTVVGIDIEGGVVLVESGTAEVRLNGGAIFVVHQGQCLLAFHPGGPRLVSRPECEPWLGRYEAMLAALRDAELAQTLDQLCPRPAAWSPYMPVALAPAPGAVPSREQSPAGEGKADGTAAASEARQDEPDTSLPLPPTEDEGSVPYPLDPRLKDWLAGCFPVAPGSTAAGGGSGGQGGLLDGNRSTSVDEPSIWGLLASGAFLLLWAPRRRHVNRRD